MNRIYIYMADSRSNREVKKWIFLKFSENVLQLILDTPEFFQIFLTHSFGDIRGQKLNFHDFLHFSSNFN